MTDLDTIFNLVKQKLHERGAGSSRRRRGRRATERITIGVPSNERRRRHGGGGERYTTHTGKETK